LIVPDLRKKVRSVKGYLPVLEVSEAMKSSGALEIYERLNQISG
jgi:hypothetical protein